MLVGRVRGARPGDGGVLSGEGRFMRLLRFAAGAVLLAIPVMVAATPATYAATTGPASPGSAGSAGLAAGSHAFATPSTATPGSKVTFTVNCDQGLNAGGADAILIGTTLSLPSRIPMNSINGSLFNFAITVTLPSSILPGAFDPEIQCPGGAESANASLLVTPVPNGGAATGDGTTSTTTDSRLALAGLVLIGIGALAGGFALRRRGASRARSDG
jgi:hypothetical protein